MRACRPHADGGAWWRERLWDSIPAFEADLAREETYFRKHLLTEDIAGLKRLEALCAQSPDFAAFEKAGMRIGWTRDLPSRFANS